MGNDTKSGASDTMIKKPDNNSTLLIVVVVVLVLFFMCVLSSICSLAFIAFYNARTVIYDAQIVTQDVTDQTIADSNYMWTYDNPEEMLPSTPADFDGLVAWSFITKTPEGYVTSLYAQKDGKRKLVSFMNANGGYVIRQIVDSKYVVYDDYSRGRKNFYYNFDTEENTQIAPDNFISYTDIYFVSPTEYLHGEYGSSGESGNDSSSTKIYLYKDGKDYLLVDEKARENYGRGGMQYDSQKMALSHDKSMLFSIDTVSSLDEQPTINVYKMSETKNADGTTSYKATLQTKVVSGTFPFWKDNSTLLYVSTTSGSFMEHNFTTGIGAKVLDSSTFSGQPYNVSFDPTSGKLAFSAGDYSSYNNNVYMINLKTDKLPTLVTQSAELVFLDETHLVGARKETCGGTNELECLDQATFNYNPGEMIVYDFVCSEDSSLVYSFNESPIFMTQYNY